MTRAEFRNLVRLKLYETGTPDLWQDGDLDDLADEEFRSLPSKRIYKEYLYTGEPAGSLVTVDDQKEYSIPSGTREIEMVEINEGTATVTDWQEVIGWETYADKLYLPYKPTGGKQMRYRLQKGFTAPSTLGETVGLDLGENQIEAAVLGTVLRAYHSLMGFFVDNKNWDAIAKPDGVSMNQVQSWIREVKSEYLDVVRNTRTVPRVREINLVG